MENKDKPWIAVIPGGQWQEKLVRYLSSQLYRVAVVNPFASETTAIADLWINKDIMDVSSYAAEVEALSPVALITDQCDIALEPVRKLADALHMNYHPQDVIDIFRDKFEMYQHAVNCGIMQPKTKVVRTRDEAEEAIEEVGYPFVIKPTDTNSSMGIQFVRSDADQYDAEFSINMSYRKTALVQRLIDGRHLSVDGAIVNGKHHCLTVGERFYMRPGVIGRVNYTADVSEKVREKLFEAVDRFVNWSGADYGITHTEFFLDGNEIPYLGETALRGGGAGTSSHIVPWVSGYNSYEALLAGHMGWTATEPKNLLRRYASIQFFEFPTGVVKEIRDNVLSCPGVVLWKLWAKVGDHLTPAKDGKGRHGCMIVVGDTAEEVEAKLTAAKKEIHVTTE